MNEFSTEIQNYEIPKSPKTPPITDEEIELLNPTETIQHSYDASIEDDFNNEGKANIHLWCLDRQSNPVLIRIRDFPVFCHLELPSFVDGLPYEWDDYQANKVYKYIQYALGEDSPIGYKFVSKYKIYYYRCTKYPMLLIMFSTIKAMRHCQNFFNKPKTIRGIGSLYIKMWETSISIIRKFFTIRDCQYSQWFNAKGVEVPVNHELRISTPGTKNKPLREYICGWEDIFPIKAEDSVGWMSFPRILAFDVETYTDNHRAMPNEFDARHVVYLNSLIYQELGKPETIKQYIIIMGDCDPIENVTILRAETEYDIVKLMADVVNELDPEIITGYNILSYDYNYLDVRIKTKMHDWPAMGRLLYKMPEMKTVTWQSSGYGHNSISNLMMDGRVNIDMLPIVRRDYKLDKYTLDFVCHFFLKKGKHDVKAEVMFEIYEGLQKATYQLKLQPDNLSLQEEYKQARAEMTRVARYCIQDSYLCIELFEKLKVWIGLLELSNIVGVTVTELFTRGQACRVMSQIYDLASRLQFVLDKRTVEKRFFNGGAVSDPCPGMYDNIICLDFASLYPSIMQAYNICFSTLIPPDLVSQVPEKYCNISKITQEEPLDGKVPINVDEEEDEGKIEGVNDQEEPEEEEEEVKVVKKTITRQYEYRYVKKEIRNGILPQLVKRLVDQRSKARGEIKKLEVNMKKYVLLEKMRKECKTIEDLGSIIEEKIQSEDKATYEWYMSEMNNMNGNNFIDYIAKNIFGLDLQLTVLDKRQLALKISANSIYGFLGAQNGFMPLIEGAMSVTSWGRELIGKAVNFVIEKYGNNENHGYEKIDNNVVNVYGDTDSFMVDLRIKNAKDCNRMGKQLSIDISGKPEERDDKGNITSPEIPGLFPPPLRMEFEKAMRILVFKKKKYAYYMIKNDGGFAVDKDSGEIIIIKKGIVLTRRDNCKLLKKVYTDLLRHVMDRKNIVGGFKILTDMCASLLNYEIQPRDNLTIIRELGSDYKSANFFMKIFSDELRKLGRPANPGDRLEFIFVKTEAEVRGEDILLGQKMRTLELWEESQNTENKNNPYPPEDIDVVYYIEHLLMNPLDQLFSVGFQHTLKKYEVIGFTPKHSRKHPTSVKFPMKMIASLVNDIMVGYKIYKDSDMAKLKNISQTVKGLPQWFEGQQKLLEPKSRLRIVG